MLAIASTLVTLGWTISTQWMTTAVMRELPAARESGQLGRFVRSLRSASVVSLGFYVVYSVAVALVALVSKSVADTLWFIVAGGAGLAVQAVAVTLFAAELRPRAYAVVDVLSRVGGIALGVTLVFHGKGIHGYLFGLAAASLVIGAFGLWAAWPKDVRPTGSAAVRGWLRYGLPVTASAVGIWLLLLVDRYLLAVLENTAAVGVYSVGNVIGDKAVALPTFAFFVAARPLLVRAFERGGRAELERMIREYTRVMFLIGAPAVAIAASSADAVVPLLVGADSYDAAIAVVPIVAIGSLIFALALIGTAGLTIARRTWPFIYAALAGLAANVAANLVLIPWLGIKGAAISTPIGTACFLLAALHWSRREAAWRVPWSAVARAVVAAVVAFGAAVGLESLVEGNLARLLVSGATTLVVYVLVLALLGVRRTTSS